MRRLAPLTILLTLALSTAAASAAPVPSATATLEECHTSGITLERYATFRAEQQGLPRSDRMAVRFDLYVREPGDTAFSRIDAPGMGQWIKSASGVGRFIWTKQVTGLITPAEYRARVSFRWYDRSGALLDRARRRTPSCRQPDQRPDLELGTLTTSAGPQPGLVRYAVPVRNAGRGDSGSFDVALAVAGTDRPPVTVSGLLAGTSQTVTFVAPRCAAGDELRVTVDPDAGVDESDERDNVLTTPCPATV